MNIKNRASYFTAFFILVNSVASSVPGQHWLHSIRLFKDKLPDVEKRLQISAIRQFDDKYLLKLNEGNLFIGISLGECKGGNWVGRWKVEEGLVVDVLFYPKPKLRRGPEFYGFKRNGFDQAVDNDHLTFRSEASGIYFSVLDRKVTGIHIFPSTQFVNLRCGSDPITTSKSR